MSLILVTSFCHVNFSLKILGNFPIAYECLVPGPYTPPPVPSRQCTNLLHFLPNMRGGIPLSISFCVISSTKKCFSKINFLTLVGPLGRSSRQEFTIEGNFGSAYFMLLHSLHLVLLSSQPPSTFICRELNFSNTSNASLRQNIILLLLLLYSHWYSWCFHNSVL